MFYFQHNYRNLKVPALRSIKYGVISKAFSFSTITPTCLVLILAEVYECLIYAQLYHVRLYYVDLPVHLIIGKYTGILLTGRRSMDGLTVQVVQGTTVFVQEQHHSSSTPRVLSLY